MLVLLLLSLLPFANVAAAALPLIILVVLAIATFINCIVETMGTFCVLRKEVLMETHSQLDIN